MYIRQYTSTNENFEYGYPNSNALLQFRLKLERCKPQNAARQPTKCDVINDVKLFRTIYRRIYMYCRKFLTLSNQMPRYKSKYIRMIKVLISLCWCKLGWSSVPLNAVKSDFLTMRLLNKEAKNEDIV